MRYTRALEGFVAATDIRNQIAAYNILGSCYMLEENMDSAYFYYDRCIELLDSLSHDHLYITTILSNLSVGYRYAGDIEKAKLYLQKVFDYPIPKREQARINYNLARLEEENDTAFYRYMQQALELMEEEDDLYFKASLYEALSEHEEEKADYFSALDHHKRYVTYIRDFFEDKYENSLKDMQHTYYLGNLEHANLTLTIRQQRLIILMLIVLLFFLFVFGWFYRQNRKAMNQIKDNINYLQRMSRFYNEKERSLRNIVLHNFNILKKVALLDQYVINNPANDKLLKRFHEIVYNNQEGINWDILYETMNKLHNDLFTRLRVEFPQVDEAEFRICCLSIARFTNIEIGLLMNYSVNTINAKKAALRKKLGVKPMGNIEEFLISYFDEKENCTFEK
ncbi:MAG: tetratricopeptide repeat protein [Bacteroides sp.]|nr:tetratricopeptide repeat protein [Bacteroides sp.]